MPKPSSALATAAVALVALGGCVERKMIVRTDPPGAMLAVDGQAVEQPTPVEVPFTWGGARRLTLAAPGYRVLDATAELSDPWYTYFPLDVFAEFLWPFTIRDVHLFDYALEPFQPQDRPFTDAQRAEIEKRLKELKLRAAEARAGGSQGPGGGVTLPEQPETPAEAPPSKP